MLQEEFDFRGILDLDVKIETASGLECLKKSYLNLHIKYMQAIGQKNKYISYQIFS